MFSNYAVASETIPASVDGILIGEAPVAFFCIVRVPKRCVGEDAVVSSGA